MALKAMFTTCVAIIAIAGFVTVASAARIGEQADRNQAEARELLEHAAQVERESRAEEAERAFRKVQESATFSTHQTQAHERPRDPHREAEDARGPRHHDELERLIRVIRVAHELVRALQGHHDAHGQAPAAEARIHEIHRQMEGHVRTREGIEQRMHHARAAAEHLHAAGMHDLAEAVIGQMEEFEEQRDGHRAEGEELERQARAAQGDRAQHPAADSLWEEWERSSRPMPRDERRVIRERRQEEREGARHERDRVREERAQTGRSEGERAQREREHAEVERQRAQAERERARAERERDRVSQQSAERGDVDRAPAPAGRGAAQGSERERAIRHEEMVRQVEEVSLALRRLYAQMEELQQAVRRLNARVDELSRR